MGRNGEGEGGVRTVYMEKLTSENQLPAGVATKNFSKGEILFIDDDVRVEFSSDVEIGDILTVRTDD